MEPRQIISRSRAVLLDFDGPVCAVFGGLPDHEVATELRTLFDGELPDDVNRSRDPFAVLKHAAETGSYPAEVERRLTELEVHAVGVAPATAGVTAVLNSLSEQGTPVVIVSNNSTAAVNAYLEDHELTGKVAGVSAREGADVDKLKPHPHLLLRAMKRLEAQPEDVVMVGDSTTDIEAARRAGTMSIGYANKPGKRAQFARYQATGIVDRMVELAPTSVDRDRS